MTRQTDIALTIPQARAALEHWLECRVKCEAPIRLHGGMINSVFLLRFDHAPGSAVIKLAADSQHGGFVIEKEKLDFLIRHTRFPCPKACSLDIRREIMPYSYLILEALPGVSLAGVTLSPDERRLLDTDLAGVLLELHGHTRDRYGDPADPGGVSDWSAIMVERLADMREEVGELVSPRTLAHIDLAVAAAREVFRDQGRPTLIHGDIWAGNILVEQREGLWRLSGIVDLPAARFADVERELAYLQVFNTVGPEFFALYEEHMPVRDGFEFRRLFYWLETYMIHVWLFGEAHYHEMCSRIAQAIADRLSS